MPRGLYIATRKSITTNDYGREIETFENPEKYPFLCMPAGTRTIEYQLYGEAVNTMYTAFIPYKPYLGKFHIGDRAYLVDEDLQDLSIALTDDEYCNNANYKIIACQPQNLVIKLVFQKIKLEQKGDY